MRGRPNQIKVRVERSAHSYRSYLHKMEDAIILPTVTVPSDTLGKIGKEIEKILNKYKCKTCIKN